MTNLDEVSLGPAQGARRASGDGPGVGRGGRMSRQRKRDAVLRLLRGEDLETVSRALGVTAATLTGWQEAFLAAGEASLAARPADGEELESGRLKARLGEMLLERELLEAKIAILEGKRPLDRRRSRPTPRDGSRGDPGDDEPDRLARRRQGLRHGPGVSGLAHGQGDRLPASAANWPQTADPPRADRPDG